MDRRAFLRTGAILLGGMALAGTPPLLPAATLRRRSGKVRVGVVTPAHCAAPIIFAHQKAFYREASLSVAIRNYPHPEALAADLLSGRLDMGQLPLPLALAIHVGSAGNGRAVPMAVPMILGTHGANLMVRNDAHIARPEDFRGKTFGAMDIYTMHYLLTRVFLAANGLRPEHDLTLLETSIRDLPDMLATDRIDAFMMPEPADSLAERNGKASTMVLSKFIWRNHPCCCLAMTHDLFAGRANTVRDFVASTTRASMHINVQRNREEMLRELARSPYSYARLPRETLQRAFSADNCGFSPFPYESTAAMALELMQEYAPLPRLDSLAVARQVMRPNFLRQCLARLGKWAPMNNTRPELIMGKVYAV